MFGVLPVYSCVSLSGLFSFFSDRVQVVSSLVVFVHVSCILGVFVFLPVVSLFLEKI